MPVRISIAATDGAARAGILHTPHGSVPTPCFMAVATCGALKGVSVQQAESVGQHVLLGNTYHLALRPGCELVHELGGLHAFTGWRGPMLTDSGGYQVFSLAGARSISEHGVAFASHIDGRKLLLSPEESIRIQRFLGADIIMAFDECPDLDKDRTAMRASCERTLRWLERSRQAWQDQAQGWPGGPEQQALYGICQGGIDPELRHWHTLATLEQELPGYAVGGLSVGESHDERNRVLDLVCPLLPADKPRYLMGVGTPLDLLEAIARGIDQFDCVLPTRMGRHGIAYTDTGPMHLKREQYARDPGAIDADTPSPADRVSRGSVRHLLKSGEMLGGQLISLHNLAYYQRLMRRAQDAIREQRFGDFLRDFRTHYDPKCAREERV